jgi:hypothetical protein
MPKSVAEKLLIKPNTTLWASHADRVALVGTLPDGVDTVAGLSDATTALVFADSAAAAREVLTAHRDGLHSPSVFWVLYPKANKADINRDSLWPILSDYGMRPISQVAVDETWSALRFRPLEEGEKRVDGGWQKA